MAKRLRILSMLLVVVALFAGTTANTQAQGKDVTFFSTQFNNVEESAKAKTILTGFKDGTAKFVGSEEGPMIDLLKAEAKAGKGTVDVVGSLHGTFPVLAGSDLMLDLSDVLADVSKDSKLNQSFVDLGKLGTKDQQYYIPWMQATYIMAANRQALQYLPKGADINSLTYGQLHAWAKNMADRTGQKRLGFPAGTNGLIPRFFQGYLLPSFSGGVVTSFKSKGAVQGWQYMRSLWRYVHPQSLSYNFLQDPLLSGEVWVAWDHVARLVNALKARPDDFVIFPAPKGPDGRGYMPVLAGLAIPKGAPNAAGGKLLIKWMMGKAAQARTLGSVGFFPVVGARLSKQLGEGLLKMNAGVIKMQRSKDALKSLLPIGLGAEGGNFNRIYTDTFVRIVVRNENIQKVLGEQAAALQAILDKTGAPCWAPDPKSNGTCKVK